MLYHSILFKDKLDDRGNIRDDKTEEDACVIGVIRKSDGSSG